MKCKVCKEPGAKFCIPCRRRLGGYTVRVVHSSAPRSAPAKAASRRRRPKATAAKHLSREAFLRRMRAGKLRAARRRAA